MGFRHAKEQDSPHAGLWQFDGAVVLERSKAVLFAPTGGKSEWLPRSKIRLVKGLGEHASVYLPDWLAREKGWV